MSPKTIRKFGNQRDLPQSRGRSTETGLRIGQLAFRKNFDIERQSSAGSVQTFRDSVDDPTISKDPWYLRGPQSVWIESIPYSEGDDSTESEGDVLGNTDDDSSNSDITSNSSEEDEPKVNEELGDAEEEDLSAETADTGEIASKMDPAESKTLVIVANGSNSSLSASSLKPKTVGFTNLTENPDRKPEDQFDVSKTKEKAEAMYYQKLAKFEDDAYDSQSKGQRNAQNMEQEQKKAQYWKIRKTIKFLKMADEEGTSVSLSALMGCDLSNVDYHEALEDTGAMETFVNLLATDSSSCRVKSLHVIDTITEVNYCMSELALDLGIAEEVRANLNSSDDTEVLAAIKCVMNLLCVKRARTIMRRNNMILIIFQLLSRLPASILRRKLYECLDEGMHRRYEIALGALYVITSLMGSPKVRNILFDCGYHSLLFPLLESKESAVVEASLKGIVLCASLKKFRRRFELENVIELSLRHWKNNEELVLKFLFKLSIGIIAREQIIKHGGLSKLVKYIQDGNNMERNPYGFKYALNCLYRLGAHPKVRDVFNNAALYEPLIKILKIGHPSYGLPISGLLSEMSIFPENWSSFVKLGGLEEILKIIFSTISDEKLLANCLKILSDVAHSRDARDVLTDFPGLLPYLLSLLNDDRPMITRCAARTLVPLTRIYDDYAEVLKSDKDSLEVAMERLNDADDGVKSAVCEALAACMIEESIFHIIYDMGLKKQLCKLVYSDNAQLLENVCGLISLCAELPEARTALGQHGVVERLAEVIVSPNIHVVIAAISALWRLSSDRENALRLQNTGVAQTLIGLATSEYDELSTSAMGCLQNIRIALCAPEMTGYLASDEGIGQFVEPPRHFPYVFKPQLFFHDEIELA